MKLIILLLIVPVIMVALFIYLLPDDKCPYCGHKEFDEAPGYTPRCAKCGKKIW